MLIQLKQGWCSLSTAFLTGTQKSLISIAMFCLVVVDARQNNELDFPFQIHAHKGVLSPDTTIMVMKNT